MLGEIVVQNSGLVRKRHRRGQRRRDKLRLAGRVLLSLVGLGIALALSAGMVHVVERPVAPIGVLADRLPAPSAPESPPLEVDPPTSE